MKLKAVDVSKKIKENIVLNNINLELESGRIYGLFGRNGSGKTMLLRCLAGIINPTSGKIFVNELELHKDLDILPNLGIIIENMNFWKFYSAYDNLKTLSEINQKIDDARIIQILSLVGLNPYDKRTISKYSLGMRQRLAIAQALMEYPDILLLDEPTNSLDESGILLFRDLMLEEKKKGTLIIIASHNREDLNLLSDVRLKMENGSVMEDS